MAMNFSVPVQCSDDVPEQSQPARAVRGVSGGDVRPDANKVDQCPAAVAPAVQSQPIQAGRAVSAGDVQPDAEKVDQCPASVPPAVQKDPPNASVASGSSLHMNKERDTIVINGKSGGIIRAEGLVSVLQPGGQFMLGDENHIIHHHGASSTTLSKQKKRKNKYKLTESTAEPLIQHLDIISAGLAQDWQTLGLHLGLTQATLNQIEIEFKGEGQHEINYRVLAKWKQQNSPVTLCMLAKALVEVGRGDLADELRKG